MKTILTFLILLSFSAFAGADYEHLDPQNLIPDKALEKALQYYDQYQDHFKNTRYISIIDYTVSASKKRYYLVNMETGEVERFLVAHGKGSDPSHSNFAKHFSDEFNSNATSLGFYRTGGTYQSEKVGYALRLQGLSNTNKNAFDRGIVVHSAPYVSEDYKPLGRSQGCPALSVQDAKKVIERIKGGSLIYAYFDAGGL